MATVEELIRERWRSGLHIGAAAPKFYMTIRRGEFVRNYAEWFGGDVKAVIPTHSQPWQATWTPTGPWMDVPGVYEVNIEQSFENNGIASANITIENVGMEPIGAGGMWHRITRGFMSPLRGYAGPGRPSVGEKNEWFDMLRRKSQIMIFGGYGEAGVPLFTGLINDVDLTSAPDRITLVTRDFGQTLTEQRLFGTVKDKALPDPITFAGGRAKDQDDTEKVGGAGRASSEEHNHPARFVSDKGRSGRYDPDTRWLSDGHGAPNVTEWVQITIPRGRYLSFYLEPVFWNMEIFISVYVYDRAPGKPSQWNNVDVPQGWLDLGKGDVPGFHGGFPYIKTAIAPGDPKYWTLGGQLECGTGTKLRISFRNLGKHRNLRPGHENEVLYRAGAKRLFAVRRRANPTKSKSKLILVEDLSDIVKVVLRWAGFKQWEVQSTGANLGKEDTLSFSANETLMDVIKKVQELTNYVFYIKPPDDIEQIGIPVFRQTRALDSSFTDPLDVIEIRDTQLLRDDRPNTAGLLAAINARFTDAPLPMSIRVRGKAASRGAGGVTLGSDKERRLMYEYRPPWADDQAGLIRHIVYPNEALKSELECKEAALLIAVAAAMKSATATFEIPLYPFFFLDEKVGLVDAGTGLATRVYIVQRQLTLRSGEHALAKMTLAGSIVDTPEFDAVKVDLFWTQVEKATIASQPTVASSHQTRTTGTRNLAPVRGTSKPPKKPTGKKK